MPQFKDYASAIMQPPTLTEPGNTVGGENSQEESKRVVDVAMDEKKETILEDESSPEKKIKIPENMEHRSKSQSNLLTQMRKQQTNQASR